MLSKFDMYWKVVNVMMAIGIVLDPRYKVDLLDYFFPLIYRVEADNEIEKVKYFFQSMLIENDFKIKEKENVSSSSSHSQNLYDVIIVGKKEVWRSNFAKHVSAKKKCCNNQVRI